MRKQTSHSKWTLRILVLFVALVPAGCAVLTVDVDMYKGPLANEETVIAEQIKAEIIGAKSLLFTLRNTLEESNGVNPYLDRYKFMRMPPDPHEQKTMWLKNQDAIRVNAILGLYEDSPTSIRDEVTLSYLDKLKNQSDRFRAIQMVMKPNAKYDRLFWDKYAKHLYSVEDHPVIKAHQQNITAVNKKYEDAKKARDKAEREKDPNEEARHGQMIQTLGDVKKRLEKQQKSLEKGLELMKRGYRELLYPDYPTEPNDPKYRPYRNISTIVYAHDKIRESYKKLPAEVRALIPSLQENRTALNKMVKTITRSQDFPKYKDRYTKYLTNESFERLQDADLVRAHVDFLFKDSLDEAQREDFKERVNLIARKFIEGRVALDESFRTALELIEYVNSKKVEDTEIDSRLTKRTIKLALDMVKSEALRAALLNKHAPPSTELLKTEMSRILLPIKISPKVPWNNNMIGPYREALLNLFEENPLAISRLLHDTHLSFIVGECEYRSDTKIRGKYKIASGRRFGILLVQPDEKDEEKFESVVVLASSDNLQKLQTGAGLDRGRLPEGLETLIDDYLILARKHSANPNDQDCTELVKKETILIDALVRFAEKVLVIANYDTLLRGNGDPNKKEEEKKKKIEQYTDVLQAVGNSIIVTANELKMKASYKGNLEDGWRREIEAMKKNFPNDVPAEISRSSGSSKEVLDDLIALLRHEYVLKIKTFGNDSNQAKWASEALDVLYKQRANMVYIRPASAYLRSSYPAASLQRDPSVAGWKNMLGRHARRSIPFFGEKAENKSKSDLETLCDIDKQSWQNINHIRVAGTGDTSYVIVKDDIGNWYIKGYKGDPEPIIKGARNMALFAASAQTGQNLTNLKEASKSNDSSPESPQIRQLREYNTRYQKQLEKDYDKLKNVVKGLDGRIASQWDVPDTNGFKKDLDKTLERPTKTLKQRSGKVSTAEDTSFMEKYMETLGAVVEYHNDIASELHNIVLSSEDDAQKSLRADRAKTTARRLMTDTLSGVLTRFIERREIASRDYETALMIIGNTGE